MSEPQPGQNGPLVAIGGAEDKESDLEILSRVFALAPAGNSEVAVIATASGIPEQVLPAYEEVFGRLGASRVHSLAVRERGDASDSANVAAVERAGVIFFTGGDQLRLTNVLGGSPLLQAIRQCHGAGAVVAGTSAGGVALSATMIYNGDATDALHKESVQMAAGLGFIEGVVIDSHFLQRGRFTRLMEVGATNPEHLGVGLGEDAAVIVHPGRLLEAIGTGHVILVDSRGLASSNVAELATGEPIAVENIAMHALTSGHGFDVEARRYLAPADLQARLQEAGLRKPGIGKPGIGESA